MNESIDRRTGRSSRLVGAYRSGRRAARGAAQWIDVLVYRAFERRRLERLRNVHRRDRCFVIGNGPSLRGVDLGPLAGEVTLVTNYFYFHSQLEILQPTYYCVSDLSFFDKGVNPEWPQRLSRVPASTVFFLPLENKRAVRSSAPAARSRIYYLRCDRRREIWNLRRMIADVTHVLWTGDTVILDFCLPLAYFMGFSEVYLLGCDTDYGSGSDAAHFYDASTPGRSREYHRHEWYANVTRSYAVARRLFEAAGRSIYNASPGGRLEEFPRIALDDVLGRSSTGSRLPEA